MLWFVRMRQWLWAIACFNITSCVFSGLRRRRTLGPHLVATTHRNVQPRPGRHCNEPLLQYTNTASITFNCALPHQVEWVALASFTAVLLSSAIAATATMPTPGNPYRQFTGVVVSAGKMTKTVKVRIPGQKWDKHIRKVSNSCSRRCRRELT